MPHKQNRNFRTRRFLALPALGLSVALAVQSAEAAPDQMILLPMGQDADGGSLLILPGEQDPESLGSDDGTFDSGGGGCEGECPGDGEDYYDEDVTHPEAPDPPPGITRTQRVSPTRPLPGVAIAPVAGVTPAAMLAAANDFCEVFNRLDRIDCLRDEYQTIARSLPDTPEYAPMRQALIKASEDLAAVVQANADPTARPVRKQVRRNSGTRVTATPIRPVAPERLAAANAQADAILGTLSTTLLRSADSAGAQRVNYERAAQAVNSAKVLLRST